ncbi:MAG TPA: Gfo/Idh/MocA family oxidoreductase [Bryobacteraceae bacterium]|nr:Gfo/Idh/MocA family oxidoreductase [Bryobacteraceae bacterium]
MSDSNRRDFLKSAGAGALATAAASSAFAKSSANARSSGRVIGANDRINVAVIGYGGRGRYVANQFARFAQNNNDACRIAAVCDVYEKRKKEGADRYKVNGYLDYRELLAKESDVDAVIVATPDHWHAKIALDAMDHGKDVYLEKPMTHTNDEARLLVNTVKETKRVLQVGSQTTSADIWWKAKKAIADGMIGKMIMSQGSYHRNSFGGEWNDGWPIDKEAGPDGKGENYIDWNMWLGTAYKLSPKRPYDADRFFRFRKYWDYSGGIATDLFYHVVAPLNICWDEPQFPMKVVGSGGIYQFKDEREVPDTFHLVAEYAKGHSMVLTSSMANDTHIPGLIRGHEGTIIMVDHGKFESMVPYITVKPQIHQGKPIGGEKYAEKFGTKDFQIPIDQKDPMQLHVGNFLECMHTRQKPHLDVETGARAVVVINLAVQSYREGKTLYWDEKRWKASDKPVKA